MLQISHALPANGKFTDDQKLIYEAVLAARDANEIHGILQPWIGSSVGLDVHDVGGYLRTAHHAPLGLSADYEPCALSP
ncbi:hypothetical protein EVAR_88196_1 [Eumeta japonica]|uniref:Uncharacterized protein n=1 Tax=Eumeta variegata TaxID=151549 RepID=A0A4C1WF37_EUMVA|nr:hypothetical protein EVAR_88196_1 [Eumeta japonica]